MAPEGRSTVRTLVEERTLTLSNLDKVLYPEAGFTKGEVIEYYRAVSEWLLPHLADRLLTRKRWPDGTGAGSFFEKNRPRGTPDWVRTVFMAEHGDAGVEYVVCNDLATLVWLANLAALELHVPQWTVGSRGAVHKPDLLVFDLDPGAPATIVDCCDVAQVLRDRLDAEGLQAFPVTTGKKGLHLYVPIRPASTAGHTSTYARARADELAAAMPELVVSAMDTAKRRGRVFIDWSQNNPAKTTIAPYSLRGEVEPTVSTPVTWDEVAAAGRPADLRFTAPQVLERVHEYGDLLATFDSARAALP
ncbi:MAG TPA: non-homologous end-joining DNA ligase [Nocardioidaceae bacterium]|nr:non-homologous end-joining DNA ligase [Nocardioidaceae bacterium]